MSSRSLPDRFQTDTRIDARTRNGRIKMLLLLLICAAPVVTSYFIYYVIRPSGAETNYGKLIEPQRPLPNVLQIVDENGVQQALTSLQRGKWLMISIDDAASCMRHCVEKLYAMRNLRIGTGKERNRIVPVWLITDDAPVDPRLNQAYADDYGAVRFLRSADIGVLQAWLPVDAERTLRDYIYLIDSQGHLMMRFPAHPDPIKMRSDLNKLLKWNPLGQSGG